MGDVKVKNRRQGKSQINKTEEEIKSEKKIYI